MVVDSHQHFWQWSRGWFSRPEPVLSRDYQPGDLAPLLRSNGIDRTIVVQTSPTVAETDYLLQLAAENDFIGGVVGWLDLESPDFEENLDRYRRNPCFIAVRPMLESLPLDWILRPRVIESLSYIARSGVPFDFLTRTAHLANVLKVLERVPGLRAVLDHLSKPDIASGQLHPWRDLISELAQHDNLFCKLSGMVTEAAGKQWTLDQLRPYANHVLEQFGPHRVMFGSDWPVCLLAASYDEVLMAARTLVTDSQGTAAVQAVFGGSAARFYGLET